MFLYSVFGFYSVVTSLSSCGETSRSAVKIPYTIKPRRAGDIATCYADPKKAKEELGWEAQYDLKRMCEDSWRYAQMCEK